jgi:hypothetical protein
VIIFSRDGSIFESAKYFSNIFGLIIKVFIFDISLQRVERIKYPFHQAPLR